MINNIMSYLDRIHESKFPIVILSLFISANVGLLLGTGYNFISLCNNNKVFYIEWLYMGLGITMFFLITSTIANFIRTLWIELIYFICKPSTQRIEGYFKINELLLYAIKYNNKILENSYFRKTEELKRIKQLKNTIFILLLFVIIDCCYGQASIVMKIFTINKGLGALLLLFACGFLVYGSIRDKEEDSSSSIKKRMKNDFLKDDLDLLFSLDGVKATE